LSKSIPSPNEEGSKERFEEAFFLKRKRNDPKRNKAFRSCFELAFFLEEDEGIEAF